MPLLPPPHAQHALAAFVPSAPQAESEWLPTLPAVHQPLLLYVLQLPQLSRNGKLLQGAACVICEHVPPFRQGPDAHGLTAAG